MKTFRQFLSEAPYLFPYPNYSGAHDKDDWIEHKSPKFKDKLLHRDGDYGIYHREYKEPIFNDTRHFVAKHKSGKVHMSMIGHENSNGWVKIKSLNKHVNSGIKAHQFYSHLVNKGMKLQSDFEQSKGGAHTWEKLHKNNPHFKFTRHSYKTMEELPIHDDWLKNYEDNTDNASVFRVSKK